MHWSYGVTTFWPRRHTYLPQTLKSLAAGGFDRPWLFADGPPEGEGGFTLAAVAREYEERWTRHVAGLTVHLPAVRTAGNWMLSLWELYLRDPWAERYAVFQDDFVTYQNLRAYLERCKFPERGYWNLYTMPPGRQVAPPDGHTGWFPSNQYGRGAVALVFSNDGVRALLAHQHMADRPADKNRGWRNVDGGVSETHKKLGWREFIHHPSLVQHTGEVSTILKAGCHPFAQSFRGEEVDAMTFMGEPKAAGVDQW